MQAVDRYTTLFEHLYKRKPRGCPEAEVTAAAERLGIEVPTALRGFYLACGSEPSILTAHNELRSPSNWSVIDGRLVFADENQGVCSWGCVPAVGEVTAEQGVVSGQRLDWYSEEVSLADFLEIMIYLQTAWGGYQYTADHQEPESVRAALATECAEVVNHNGARVLRREDVLVSELEGQGFLTAAARTEAAFDWLRGLGFNEL